MSTQNNPTDQDIRNEQLELITTQREMMGELAAMLRKQLDADTKASAEDDERTKAEDKDEKRTVADRERKHYIRMFAGQALPAVMRHALGDRRAVVRVAAEIGTALWDELEEGSE